MPKPETVRSLPDLLDVGAVAEHLGVNVRHVRRLVHERRIPFIKWGRLVRFDPCDIAAWIEANRRRPGATAGVLWPAAPLPHGVDHGAASQDRLPRKSVPPSDRDRRPNTEAS